MLVRRVMIKKGYLNPNEMLNREKDIVKIMQVATFSAEIEQF